MLILCTKDGGVMMVMRLNLRLLLLGLCIVALIIMLYWSQCQMNISGTIPKSTYSDRSVLISDDIDCFINGDYAVACKRDENEVYVPFSFLHKYFEIYGKLSNQHGVDRFEWSHSYGKVYHPKKKYDPTGTFTTFENYNVEVRERVKCVSGIEGVPVSTQWDPKGFFYPTQIAQYGLAHYSKNITEGEPKRHVIDDGETVLPEWVTEKGTTIRFFDSAVNSNVVKFATEAKGSVVLQLNISQDLVLSLDVRLTANSSFVVKLLNKDNQEVKYLHYVANEEMISADEEHVYHGIGSKLQWRHITRDLITDMQKGWALLDRPKKKFPRNKYKISSLTLYGSGSIDNITISWSEHMAAVYTAADWLVRNQKSNGGWPVQVKRRIAAGLAELMPGWHSAMSQGHAISLLARAFHRSGQSSYLEAAKRAMSLLEVPSHEGGVKAVAFHRYVWYEEYPTSPPLFVLNGFIYTLLGLYDLNKISPDDKAKKLFDEGMSSLKSLLPLYDTGSGSFYDLRHFSLGVSPNIARWDYHATHVNQLYLLAGLDKDAILLNTARRWEGYMHGKRAAHN